MDKTIVMNCSSLSLLKYYESCILKPFYSGTTDIFVEMQILWTENITDLGWSNNIYPERNVFLHNLSLNVWHNAAIAWKVTFFFNFTISLVTKLPWREIIRKHRILTYSYTIFMGSKYLSILKGICWFSKQKVLLKREILKESYFH